MTTHIMPGIGPVPLASFLAGLGLIRVLGEQADPNLTAEWADAGLVVQTTVEDVAGWLSDRYVPTPVVSPWKRRTGFGPKDRAQKVALEAIEASDEPRLAALRSAIKVARAVLVGRNLDDGINLDVVRVIRNRGPEALLPWIDAAVVIAQERAYFPALLGTGGGDGALDFSTNFHQRLLDLFGSAPARRAALARDLLTGRNVERLTAGAVGQFDPAAAGGRNSAPFGSADSVVNPWAYVLLVEGTLFFASTAVRRHQHAAGRSAVPFTVSDSPDGSASGAAGEASRGEIWAPLWTSPFTLHEVRQLFADARASWRGRPAQRAVEFYAATRTLGVARGVAAFMRYGIHQRNGLAFTAVPIERVKVDAHPEVTLAAKLEDWVWRVRGSASRAVEQQLRRFDRAQMEFARDGGPRRLARLLAALCDLEQAVGRSGRAREVVPARRPPKARDFLLFLQTEESSEFRVAVGVASCQTIAGLAPSRAMRELLLPIDPATPTPTWRDAPVVPGFGVRPLRRVLADVLCWRIRMAADEDDSAGHTIGAPTFRRGVRVPAADLHAFATPGALDDALLDLWLRACLALDWGDAAPAWSHAEPPPSPHPLLGLLQPFAEGLPIDDRDHDRTSLGLQTDWPARLVAGHIQSVHSEAVHRLRQAGWRATAVPAQPDQVELGQGIAAALVPRCLDSKGVLTKHLAVRATGSHDDRSTESEEDEREEERDGSADQYEAAQRTHGGASPHRGPALPAHGLPRPRRR